MNASEAQDTNISIEEARVALELFVQTQRNRRSAINGERVPPQHHECVLDWLADVIDAALSNPRARGPLRFMNPPHRTPRDIPPYRVARLLRERMSKGAMMKSALIDIANKLRISPRHAERLLSLWRRDNPISSQKIDELKQKNRLERRRSKPGE